MKYYDDIGRIEAISGVTNRQILTAILGRAKNDEEVKTLLHKIHSLQANMARSKGKKYYDTVLGAPVYPHEGFKKMNGPLSDAALKSTEVDEPVRLIDTAMDRAAATRALTYEQYKLLNRKANS